MLFLLIMKYTENQLYFYSLFSFLFCSFLFLCLCFLFALLSSALSLSLHLHLLCHWFVSLFSVYVSRSPLFVLSVRLGMKTILRWLDDLLFLFVYYLVSPSVSMFVRFSPFFLFSYVLGLLSIPCFSPVFVPCFLFVLLFEKKPWFLLFFQPLSFFSSSSLSFRWPFLGSEQLVVPQYVSSFLGGG